MYFFYDIEISTVDFFRSALRVEKLFFLVHILLIEENIKTEVVHFIMDPLIF